MTLIELLKRRGWASFKTKGSFDSSNNSKFGYGPICVGIAMDAGGEGLLLSKFHYEALVDTTGDDCQVIDYHNDYHISSQEEAVAWLRRADELWKEKEA